VFKRVTFFGGVIMALEGLLVRYHTVFLVLDTSTNRLYKFAIGCLLKVFTSQES
jgi:hypothetical protein